MENEGPPGSTYIHHDVSTYNYEKMMQRTSSSYTVDHPNICIPINKDSRLISKKKRHMIRIIHIVPPEIIQTDKTNFRDLVQRLTGQSSASTTKAKIKKPMKPHVISSNENKGYGLGFNGSEEVKLCPNMKLWDDPPKHEQFYLAAESDLEVLIGGIQAKVEKDEMMVPQWIGIKDEVETEFCIDEFLELSDWLAQDTKMPDKLPHVDPNWGIDMFGNF